ncbi:MAG: antibiotic biosynthesis monooxygenase family protein [Acidimicrobiia bacterium]
MGPEAGQVVTVFRSRLLEANATAYHEHAGRMSALARTMPGYVEHKVFVADDGERVTLVTFRDQASHDAWRDHPEHRTAQRAGIAGYYEAYSIAVGTVGYASSFARPGAT